MIRRIYSIISTRISSPEGAAGIFSLFTLITTTFGYLRDRLLATTIGPGPVLDAYSLAHKVPDFLYATTVALAAGVVVIPLLSKSSSDDDRRHIMSQLFTVFMTGWLLLSIILFIVMPWLLPLVAGGFSADVLDTSVLMSRILLLSPIAMGLSTLLASYMQFEQRFVATSLQPVLYNVVTVLVMWLLYPVYGAPALAIAIVVAALAHLSIPLLIMVQRRVMPIIQYPIDWSLIRRVFRQGVARTVALSANTITALGVAAFMSYLPSGSLSIYTLVYSIQNVPITLIGLSLSTAAFPTLVQYVVDRNYDGFSAQISRTVRIVVLLAAPIIAIGYVLRVDLIRILYGSGLFTEQYIVQAGQVLGLFLFALIAVGLLQLGVRVYYAHNNTRRPLIQSLLGMAITLIAMYIVYRVYGLSVPLIVLCIILGNVMNMGILWYSIMNRYMTLADRAVTGRALMVCLVSAGITYLVSVYLHQYVSSVITASPVLSSFIICVIVASVGYVIYMLLVVGARIPEASWLYNQVTVRLRKLW